MLLGVSRLLATSLPLVALLLDLPESQPLHALSPGST